jgi:tetratricopeptide (TPR) repeat protein
VHEHLSDAELARYATDPESIEADWRQVIEEESERCAICRTSLDFFGVVSAEELADVELWEAEVDWRSEDDPMQAYIERIATEDREADELLAERKLLSSPTKMAFTNVQRDKRLLTGGVVRRFIAHANKIHEDELLDAVTFADAAILIAESLPDNAYPWKSVFELRGGAWTERARALFVAGEFSAAFEALRHAERAYGSLRSPGFGISSVALLRAGILCEQDRLTEAAAWAEKAEAGFAHLGQEERRMRAVFLRGSIKYEAGEFAAVIKLFEQVLEYGEAVNSPRWIARASYAIGNCEVDRRNLGEASMYFHKALVIFREIGPDRERLAAEWGLSRVVLHGGDRSEAIRRLRVVAIELEKRSMIADAALVRLDIVEALLGLAEAKQITEIAARLFRLFKDAGMMTGALTAMAYMKEAATAGKLTTVGVNAVRTYLRRSLRQPELVFQPPSDPFRRNCSKPEPSPSPAQGWCRRVHANIVEEFSAA